MSAHVHCKRGPHAHVGRIVLARADAGNAFTLDMVAQFREALRELEQDDAIKVIVIEAEGADLTRGFDAAQAEQMLSSAIAGGRKVPSQRARLVAVDRLWWGPDGIWQRLLHCTKVTILAARGACREVGLYLALYADLVVADDTAWFDNPRWRHVGVDGDISMLVATVGLKRASELMFCGGPWRAQQAVQYGLVDKVVPPDRLASAIDELALLCASVMRDGIVTEKHVVFASLAKMQVSAGMAAASVVGGWASNVHFRPGEFNFLREARQHGVPAALEAADAYFDDSSSGPA